MKYLKKMFKALFSRKKQEIPEASCSFLDHDHDHDPQKASTVKYEAVSLAEEKEEKREEKKVVLLIP